LPREAYEILVIDNGSTDATADVLEEYEAKHGVHWLYEPVVGLSRARNMGWKNVRTPYLGYIDDDAVAAPAWLETALDCFKNVNPKPVLVAGAIHLEWNIAPPSWINDELLIPLGYVYWGNTPRFLSSSECLGGGNSFYDRSFLSAFGGFNKSLGIKGNRLLWGEETQLQKRIEAEGGFLYYHPGVCIRHFVSVERTRPSWFYRRYYWGGVSDYIMGKTLNSKSFQNDIHTEGRSNLNRRKEQISRVVRNSRHSLGLFSSREEKIHGRIYMSYVFGWFVSLFHWHLQRLFNLFRAGK